MVFCFLFVRPWEKDALSKDLWTDLTILMWYEHTPKSNDRWKVILTEYKQILLWYSALPQSHTYVSLLHFYSKSTVESVLVAAASNHFDEIFDQNLLSKKWILLRLLFEGGFYLRAASNTDYTVIILVRPRKGYDRPVYIVDQ